MSLNDSAHVPLCTYRLQLNGKFTFADLAARLPFFTELGITDFYLSPIFTATPGSLHGYDVTDYGKINPELGGNDGLSVLATRLRSVGCDILLDFVPNHMGIAGMLNSWWRDVLENGRLSPYAAFFDIQWKEESYERHPRVLVPVLADHYGRVLEEGRIKMIYQDELLLSYGDVTLPVRPYTYPEVLRNLAGDPANEALVSLVAQFSALPRSTGPIDQETAQKRADLVEKLKRELAALVAAEPVVRERLENRLRELNGTPGDPRSFDQLHELIERQHYRLARWITGAHEINYRRFFAIDSLVGLHMEKSDVFRECHLLLARLLREGKVAGLRIDHIDGLRQPEVYLQRLQSLERPDGAKPLYVLVEKILATGEPLPERWPVHGTTGYEFISQLAGAFVASANEGRFNEIYERATGEKADYRDVIYEKKRMIIREMFVNAVSNLGADLVEILEVDRHWRDLTRHELTTVVSELMANLPVYRTYRRNLQPVSAQDRRVLEEACARALARNPRAEPQPFEFVRDLLIGSYPPAEAPEELRSRLLSWVLTFQQYTGAVMAKAVEDTAFYTYNRLVGLNEVGGDPGRFGGTVEEFHRTNLERLARAPLGMLATSTHDTKFSEDVRARLYALSELSDEWETWVREWRGYTSRHAASVEGTLAPDGLDLYRLFQVLLGAWPLEPEMVDDAFRARLREHVRKSVNEAKRHTSILQSNDAYLDACERFVDTVTRPERAPDFLVSFTACAQRLARLGMVNSLSQVVLKCTVPGVPDFYQGNEIWDFSLVDPDNRREVDFDRRQALLADLNGASQLQLLENWRDGRIKLWVMQTLLKFRGKHPALFLRGDYAPVLTRGAYADHVLAFRRQAEGHELLVVVPRLTAKIGVPPLGLIWDDTSLSGLGTAAAWTDLFTAKSIVAEPTVHLRNLFSEAPYAVLHREIPLTPRTP